MTTEATPVAMEVWRKAVEAHRAATNDPNFVTNHSLASQAAAAVIATALKLARHDERLKFVHQPCRHTTKAENETKRPDLHDWQTAQSEWFDATILEIVGEYAAWRDQHTATALADMQRRVEELEAENAALRRVIHVSKGPSPENVEIIQSAFDRGWSIPIDPPEWPEMLEQAQEFLAARQDSLNTQEN